MFLDELDGANAGAAATPADDTTAMPEEKKDGMDSDETAAV